MEKECDRYIPKELQKEEFRFCKIKRNEKAPFENSWQQKGYKYDDKELLVWIKTGNNYGVIGGFGNLLLIDFDDEIIQQQIIPLLPETFTVRSGSGLLHKYFYCDNVESFKVLDDDKETMIDVQGKGKMLVGAGSTHPNGNKYSLIEDKPISKIDYEWLRKLIDKKYKKDLKDITPVRNHNAQEIKKEVKLSDILLHYGYDLTRNPTMCLLGHGSDSKKCFSFNTSEDLWKCFHCDKGGDIFNLVMEHEQCSFIEAKNKITEWYGLNQPKTKPYKIDNGLMVYNEDYIEMAKKFFMIQPFYYDQSGMWWLWNFNEKYWSMIDDTDLMNMLKKECSPFLQLTKGNVFSQIIRAMQMVGRENKPEDAHTRWVQFKDKAFSLRSGQIHNITSDYFFCNPIPWEPGNSIETPMMDQMFEQWVGKDNVKTLYEIIAYSCYRDYPIHLIFCLVGCGRNGKSTFQRLLIKFIGASNISSTELDTLLDSRFESIKLYKKLICTVGETNFGIMAKTSLLKKLSGQDLIGFEKKGKQPFDDYNYSKIIINSNSLPTSEDTSEGFYRRWLIIDFPNQFPEGHDILKDIPNIEFNNLALKITQILPRLLKEGKFTNQGSIEDRQRRYIEASNPLSLFLEEYCERGIAYFVRHTELYKNYCDYLNKHKKRIVSRKEFDSGLLNEGLEKRRTSKNISLVEEFSKFEYDHWVEGVKLKNI